MAALFKALFSLAALSVVCCVLAAVVLPASTAVVSGRVRVEAPHPRKERDIINRLNGLTARLSYLGPRTCSIHSRQYSRRELSPCVQ